MDSSKNEIQESSDHLSDIFQIGQALEERIGQLEEKLEDQINKVVELSNIGAVFTSILDLEVVLPMVIETAVSMVRGEVGEVVIYGDKGQVKSVSWGLSSDITRNIRVESGKQIYDQVRETGESLILGEVVFDSVVAATYPNVNIKSLLVSPLKSKDRVIGVIAVANKMAESGFDLEDKFALEMIGNFAAVAILNADLHREALNKQKLDQELQFARHVQRCLMPEKEMIFDGVSIYAYNAQASQIGGDFFDILQIAPQKYLIIVADVSNKGVPAALVMATTMAYIRLASERMDSVSDLASKLNNLLCRDTERLDGVFVTMIMGLVDMDKREIVMVNAGHPPCFVVRGKQLREIGSGGVFLGQFPNIAFEETHLPIEVGDRVYIFTDGIFECVNSKNEMLGLDKARQFMLENSDLPWPNFLEKLKQLLTAYSYDPGRIDDTTLMLVEITQ